MTPETRETLTWLLNLALLQVETYPADSRERRSEQEKIAALRDVLTPRTCGNCEHGRDKHTRGTFERPYEAVCCFKRGGVWRVDDGCIKGWQAREGEGGTR